LYKKELYLLKVCSKLSIASLFFSVCFVYFVVLPGVISFFTHFESSRLFELTLEAKISDYLELVLQCLFWVSLVFQTPVAIFLSVYSNIINVNGLAKKKKRAYSGLFYCRCFIISSRCFNPIADSLASVDTIRNYNFCFHYDWWICALCLGQESCSNGKRWVC
jgi:Sec-independent protein secretion pathway component TatC